MKRLVMLALLIFLAGCSTKFIQFQEEQFSAQYPDWNAVEGKDKINVQKGSCLVNIGTHAAKFNPQNLKITVDISIIPALKRSDLFIEDYQLEGNEATLELTGNNVYGKQKYIACNNSLYKVSAACNKKDPIIDSVVNSAKCSQ